MRHLPIPFPHRQRVGAGDDAIRQHAAVFVAHMPVVVVGPQVFEFIRVVPEIVQFATSIGEDESLSITEDQ